MKKSIINNNTDTLFYSKEKEYISIFTIQIEERIKKLLESKKNKKIPEDILLNQYFAKHENEMNNSLIIKQIQMKIGNIWQIVIGNYCNFKDLGIGHHSGLDVKNKKRKIIMEIKNRYNTDNSSSKKTNLDKLVEYKKKHPDFECIYAVINDIKKDGQRKIIIHNNIEIIYCSGMILLNYIFENDTKIILNILQNIINSYLI
jgi:hypothetical protein